MSDARKVLEDLTGRTSEAFERNRRILSFREYLELALEQPWQLPEEFARARRRMVPERTADYYRTLSG